MNSFNSKILLFGEYAIIKGSRGIAFPLEEHFGALDFSENTHALSQKLRLDELYNYLVGSSLIKKSMNLARMERDIKNGLYFKSNIPHGYGIGSSGALCASLFAEYAYTFERKSFYTAEELNELKDLMALMEAFYHGTSSGVDCLISLINLPLLMKSRSQVEVCKHPLEKVEGSFFLYDSGKSRSTSAFVHEFLESYETNDEYKQQILNFVELTDSIINKIIDYTDFENELFELSTIQFQMMPKMIPDNIISFWKNGLETKKYLVKLCGAGGGGYFIVYSKDNETINHFEQNKSMKRINYVSRV